ncbi:DUF1223 domain-containing protein [Trinickia violacea]|uniref:DUF1223 domain-containing protein n=1 Tax=Trinickia violacea TaxID=2571746 RepID=A0A4P8ILL6_9BURK|nr:DUF1223 domain-containing protein [Trinickia violacea]QCP49166.1 DUF1223 domain-containing protein [Trinickia violacea]
MHTRTRTTTIWRWAAWAIALPLSLGANGLALAGVACSAHSPAHRVALVELYSSEGCSSCPPADRWLSQLHGGSPGADIVPLELHVDYWNRLGWTDRFSQHRFTERQENLAAFAGGHLIYTPEVFVAGRELRDWGASDFDGRLRELAAQPAQADVAIRLAPVTPGAASQAGGASGAGSGAAAAVNPQGLGVDAQFTARSTAPRTLNAYVAVYENQLSSQVDAGENHGATLHHDRVVRAWLGPVPLVGGVARIRRNVVVAADASDTASPGRFGVAAFIEDAATGDVLQAADLPACR